MAGAGSKRRDAKNTRSFITYSWEKALKPQNLVNAKSPANPKDERGVFRISAAVRARIFSAVRNDTRYMVYKSLFSSPLFPASFKIPIDVLNKTDYNCFTF